MNCCLWGCLYGGAFLVTSVRLRVVWSDPETHETGDWGGSERFLCAVPQLV